ncbi:MAG: N-acetyltransferase [Acidobacteriota bacterium]|nr:GNAT family N-acetyltransferase [Blastocatellia bacterium]MDW8413118.1 N-acetyltransferase [Acidobacteriota bacterium]
MTTNKPQLIIDRLQLTDLEECYQLDQICFREAEAYDRATISYILSNPRSICYKIVSQQQDQTRMLGFILAMIEEDLTGHIVALGVLPEARRQGYARLLMELVESALLYRKINLVHLEVRISNKPAQRLYTRLGYIIVKRLENYYTNGEDAYLMVKSLTEGED